MNTTEALIDRFEVGESYWCKCYACEGAWIETGKPNHKPSCHVPFVIAKWEAMEKVCDEAKKAAVAHPFDGSWRRPLTGAIFNLDKI